MSKLTLWKYICFHRSDAALNLLADDRGSDWRGCCTLNVTIYGWRLCAIEPTHTSTSHPLPHTDHDKADLRFPFGGGQE